MSRPDTPTYKTLNWPAYNKALKRRGSLAILFDPDMVWAAKPTGERGRQPVYSDAAIQTCLTMKVLFGMALRQTTGFMESLLRLIGLDWDVPDFSTLSRRQKSLAVNIPHRGSQGPLHLLIDSTGIKVEGEGEWNARKHGGPKRRVWRKIHIGIDEQTLEIRAVEVTQPDPSRSGDRKRHRRRGLRHAQVPRRHRRTRRPSRDPAPQERQALEGDHGRRGRAQRSTSGIEIPRPFTLATMERISPPKPRRNENALRQTLGSTPHGAGLRPPGR
jgi:hypothetical protein